MSVNLFGAEPEIVKDAKKASEWIVRAMNSSGYELDYSIESLKEIDRFFDEQSKDGNAVPDGLLSEDLGSRLFSIGAYVGEVLARHVEGKWKGNDEDPKSEINIAIEFPDGSVCWPVQRVIKRLQNGKEDSIYAYGKVLAKEK